MDDEEMLVTYHLYKTKALMQTIHAFEGITKESWKSTNKELFR